MQINDFLVELAEVLEIEDSLTVDSDLTEFEEYDSMAVLALIAFIDESFGKRIPGTDFLNVTTVQSLMDLIGAENFQ